ncbi:putative integral membrane protein [Thermosipho africanus TCF52B]|jgi:ESS family glutamate:Na+ symporter|uniref:Putative integral membrane protein n=1 Tax=Thermosipho africanus (strain TCF52B) TaxID=484019 RepID=B7ID60_THEAB|nr:membrane protein [Thermosipho africanus]ACJ75937.1 putative integral membrane protein [Thermosipho africanus TCF52B]
MFTATVNTFFIISILYAIAILLKRFIPLLRKIIIPNSILAGFLGFLLGPNLLNIVKIDVDFLGKIIYHLMAIGFIALALRKVEKNGQKGYLGAGLIIVGTYLFQGILGVSLGFLINLFDKDFSPAIGYLIPLGFGQGPGQAYSIGMQWETLGLHSGSSIGLAIAAAGFGWATVGGLVILNLLLVKWKKSHQRTLIEKKAIEVRDYEFSDMDGMTIQMVIIGIVYFITFILLKIIEGVLSPLGNTGRTFSTVLWGFHFVIGAIVAMVFRKLYDKLKAKNIAKENYLNNFLLQRIAGVVFDFMVTASISAVVLAKIQKEFWGIFILTFAAGILTYFFVMMLTKKVFTKNEVENRIAFFGMLTGTISTGMALLREVDPALESGASENLVFGSGFSMLVGVPLIAILNFPAFAISNQKNILNLYGLIAMILYGLLLLVIGKLFLRSKN